MNIPKEPHNLYAIKPTVIGPVPIRVLSIEEWKTLLENDKQTLEEMLEKFVTIETVKQAMIKWHEDKASSLKAASDSTLMNAAFKIDGKLRDGIAGVINQLKENIEYGHTSP